MGEFWGYVFYILIAFILVIGPLVFALVVSSRAEKNPKKYNRYPNSRMIYLIPTKKSGHKIIIK